MTPLVMGAIQQGVATGGSILTNILNAIMQERNNRIMREREDTAVQRRAQDLENAGINPMLAGLGQGAQAQLGGMVPMTSGSAETLGNVTQALSKSESNLAEANKDRETIEYMKTEKRLLISQIEQNQLLNERIKEETKFIIANTQKTSDDTLDGKFRRDLMKAQTYTSWADKNLKTASTVVAYRTVNKIEAEIQKLGSEVNLNNYKKREIYENTKRIAQDAYRLEQEGKLKKKDVDNYIWKRNVDTLKTGSEVVRNLAGAIKPLSR